MDFPEQQSATSKPTTKKASERWFNNGGQPYFCLPKTAALDSRLREAELRILLILASHAISKDNVWPSRERLVELSGLHRSTVSQATTRLAQLGWLTKSRRGFRGMSYTLSVPTLDDASS
jgi:DNA-binding MarR family transcriptional regulator